MINLNAGAAYSFSFKLLDTSSTVGFLDTCILVFIADSLVLFIHQLLIVIHLQLGEVPLLKWCIVVH